MAKGMAHPENLSTPVNNSTIWPTVPSRMYACTHICGQWLSCSLLQLIYWPPQKLRSILYWNVPNWMQSVAKNQAPHPPYRIYPQNKSTSRRGIWKSMPNFIRQSLSRMYFSAIHSFIQPVFHLAIPPRPLVTAHNTPFGWINRGVECAKTEIALH